MNRRELQRLLGLMVQSGALQGHWSIEDGRRGVKYTRTAKGAGADDNQDGKQGGGIG